MRSLIRELIETVILALLIFLALQFSVQNFKVEGSSMQPTLEEGEYLLVNKIVYFHLAPSELRALLPFGSVEPDESVFPIRNPQRGDVIIFGKSGNEMRKFIKGYNLKVIEASMILFASATIVCYIMYTVSNEVTSRLGSNNVYLTSILSY